MFQWLMYYYSCVRGINFHSFYDIDFEIVWQIWFWEKGWGVYFVTYQRFDCSYAMYILQLIYCHSLSHVWFKHIFCFILIVALLSSIFGRAEVSVINFVSEITRKSSGRDILRAFHLYWHLYKCFISCDFITYRIITYIIVL